MRFFEVACTLVTALFVIMYAHQVFYMLYATAKKPKPLPGTSPRRYAVLIAARNEESVIGGLIESIRAQNYPADMVSVFVVADNCSDSTARAAENAGARVWERFNKSMVGKGYALDFLLSRIDFELGLDSFDGYFIFDADNLLDENFISEMNKSFAQGHRVVTSFRNSKNFGDSWVSATHSLWFMHSTRLLNKARMLLGTSSFVSGTGFLVHRDILIKMGGWKFFQLTEDQEFSANMIMDGEYIAYCDSAVFYVEQPTSLSQSWWQRLRWAKGTLQMFRRYGARMVVSVFKKKSFACFDVSMAFLPAIVLSFTGFVLSAARLLFLAVTGGAPLLLPALGGLCAGLLVTYCAALTFGTFATAVMWKSILAPAGTKIKYVFFFPAFMLLSFPLMLAAMFQKVSWRPIRHSVNKSLDQVRACQVSAAD